MSKNEVRKALYKSKGTTRVVPSDVITLSSFLDVARKSEHQENENNQAQSPARIISPAPAIGPRGQGAYQQENQEHEQNRRH